MMVCNFPDIERVRAGVLAATEQHGQEVLSRIDVETGCPQSWLVAFKNGYSKDPAYSRVCKLIPWLAEKGYLK